MVLCTDRKKSAKFKFQRHLSSTNIPSNFKFQRFFVQQCDVISEKFSAYNLAGECSNF